MLESSASHKKVLAIQNGGWEQRVEFKQPRQFGIEKCFIYGLTIVTLESNPDAMHSFQCVAFSSHTLHLEFGIIVAVVDAAAGSASFFSSSLEGGKPLIAQASQKVDPGSNLNADGPNKTFLMSSLEKIEKIKGASMLSAMARFVVDALLWMAYFVISSCVLFTGRTYADQ
jgi:hypothetical protein